jgi:hypothetical protein
MKLITRGKFLLAGALKEHSMYAYIENTKSIEEAEKKFGRL